MGPEFRSTFHGFSGCFHTTECSFFELWSFHFCSEERYAAAHNCNYKSNICLGFLFLVNPFVPFIIVFTMIMACLNSLIALIP